LAKAFHLVVSIPFNIEMLGEEEKNN